MPGLLRVLLLLACLPAQGAWALQLQLEARGLDAQARAVSERLLVDSLARLPPSFRQRLAGPVSVRWSTTLPDEAFARADAWRARIELNARLLPALLADPQQPARGRHASLELELQATVLHELAHLYDRARYWTPAERRLHGRCRQQLASLGAVGLPGACRGQTARRYTLSDHPRLLDLAGWPQAVGRRGAREAFNGQQARSVDRYELSHPREFFAVNFEHFLLDPQYACRRPSLAALFSEHFAWQPPRQAACAKGLAYLNAGSDFARAPLARLDPARLYRVDYLLAEGNQQWASRFGHSMLRLVLCAPGRAPGEDCLLDVEHHLVLSFRAYVDDVQLSSWGGLSGAYPSRLFVLPLAQVIDEYTRVELRSLQSVPLRLSADQRRALLTRALEQHWSYDGRYFFISNNCAVETLKLLRSGTADPHLADLDSLLPNGLLQLLVARGLADPSALAEPREAERLGYRFASYRERYTQLFAGLQADWGLPYGRVEDWLDAPPTQRQAWFARASLRQSAALLVLEQAARRRLLLRVQDELKQRYLSESPEALAPLGEGLQRLLQQSGFLSRPAELLGTQGYGLPQDEEWQRLAEHSAQRQAQLQQLAGQLDAALLQLLDPAQRAELAAQDANLRELSAQLRRLQRGAGGLRL